MGTDPQNPDSCPGVDKGFDADFDLDGSDLIQIVNGLSTGTLTHDDLEEFATGFGK